MRHAILGMIVVAAAVAFAGEADLNFPQARKAMQEYDQRVAVADAAYKQAQIQAKVQCIDDLKKALATAMRETKLDDANAINAQVDRLQLELDVLRGKSRTFEIRAATMWNDTLQLSKGQRVHVKAAGTWSPNGLGEIGNVLKWPPRARIGDGPTFTVGGDYTFIADASGMLQLGIDDGAQEELYRDNIGVVTIEVTLLPPK